MRCVVRIECLVVRRGVNDMPTAEIIAVGNELLNGDVQDTNTHWLCRRLTGLGATVRHCATVRDDEPAIAAEVSASLARDADLVVTTGGMGPTQDDLTLSAVATAVGVGLAIDERALTMVTDKYRELAADGHVESADITASRKKMSMLPEGATPLANPVGAAPGVLLEVQNAIIVCVPGVPAELQGIVNTSLAPTLRRLFGSASFVEDEVVAHVGDESVLAPALAEVAAQHPGVYVKSRPKRFGPDVRIRITVSARGSSEDEASGEVASALRSLRRALAARGISCSTDSSSTAV